MKEKGHPEYNYKDKSRPVPKSSNFSKSRTFNTLKTKEKKLREKKRKKFKIFFSNTSQFRFFDNKFASRDLIIWELITHTGPAGLVWQIWVSGPVWSGNSHAQSSQATACFVKKILPGFGAEWHAPYTWLLTRIVAKKETNLSQQKSS